MADNTQINAGSGGDMVATDDIGGVKYPRSKIVLGNDGQNDGDVSASNPLPVSGTVTSGGDVAHNVVDAGNPVKLGGRAASSAPPAVSAGDRVNAYFDPNGRLVVVLDTALPAGSNALGSIDVSSQPALSANVDAVTAKMATDSLQDGLTALTPKFASIDATTSGDNEIVAAVAGKKIRVIALFLETAGTVQATLQSDDAGGTPVDVSGPLTLTVNSVVPLSFCPFGWFETAAGKKLNLKLDAAVAVAGMLVYVEV